MRFLLSLLIVFAVAMPIAAPAMATATRMEHCEDSGHSAPASSPDDKRVMNHQVCCVAVDPGKLDAVDDQLSPAIALGRPINDQRLASTASGADPPPPRVA